jgi:hypothetical protein
MILFETTIPCPHSRTKRRVRKMPPCALGSNSQRAHFPFVQEAYAKYDSSDCIHTFGRSGTWMTTSGCLGNPPPQRSDIDCCSKDQQEHRPLAQLKPGRSQTTLEKIWVTDVCLLLRSSLCPGCATHASTGREVHGHCRIARETHGH